jgi:hypothetical protein
MNANYDSDDPEERTNEGGNVGEQQEEDGTETDDDRDDDDTEQGGDEGEEDVNSDEHEEEVSSDEEEEHSSEEASSDENEGSSDDGEDDDSNDGGDRDIEIVGLIQHVLGEGARSSEWIWIARYDEEEFDLMDLVGELTDHGMDILLKAVKRVSSWDRQVKQLVFDLSDPFHDLKFALRITKILDCLNLASLEQFDILWFEDMDDGTALQLWKPLVLDHYVNWIATAPCITRPERLSKFCLGGLGHDPKVWDAFVARFSSLREVNLELDGRAGQCPNGTLCATALASSMGRLPLLCALKIEYCAPGLSSILTCLARGFVLLRNLQTFSFHTQDGRGFDNEGVHDSDVVLEEMCRGLALCPSLKDVRVMFDEGASKKIKDFGALFDHLRTSRSIEKLQLRCVDIHTRSETHLGLPGSEPGGTPSESTITNQSVKSLVLNDCSIGRSYASVLAKFSGVENISLKWHSHNAQRPWRSTRVWAMLFRALPQLKSIVVGNVDFAPASIDEDDVLAALVASLDLAEAVDDWTVCTNSCPRNGQSVRLPSLEQLLRKCSGKLTLRHEGINDSTCESLCAGLRVTPFLTNLQLIVSGEAMTNRTVASIFGALQENRSVKTFHGKFLFDLPLEVGILDPVLVDLLSTNSALEVFRLDLLVRGGFFLAIEGDAPPDYAELVVAPIANALAPNRKLKVLCLNGLERVDPVSFAALTGMLKSNVSLEQIKFHDSVEDSEAKDTIEWLLTLNRYKRRCLFQNADPVQRSSDDEATLGVDHHNPLEVPRPASDPDSLPAGVWPAVLERIATDRRADVMYHFLRRMPKSLWVASLSLFPPPPPPPPPRQSGRGLKRACP